MAKVYPTCEDVDLVVNTDQSISCVGAGWGFELESPNTLASLSSSELSTLMAGSITLFAIAFSARFLIYFISKR